MDFRVLTDLSRLTIEQEDIEFLIETLDMILGENFVKQLWLILSKIGDFHPDSVAPSIIAQFAFQYYRLHRYASQRSAFNITKWFYHVT